MKLRGGKELRPVSQSLAEWVADEKANDWVDWVCVGIVCATLAVYVSALACMRLVGDG